MRRALVKVLLVALASVVMGGAGGWVLDLGGLTQYLEGPFAKGGGAAAAAYNVLLFLALLLVGAFTLLVLLRKGVSVFKLAGYTSFALAALTVTSTYLAMLPLPLRPYLVLSAAAAALLTLPVILSPSSLPAAAAQVLVGSLVGSIIAAMMSRESMLAVLLAVAAYDALAVYRGPLRHIIQRARDVSQGSGGSARSLLTPFVVDVGDLALGMGDVVMYASMGSLALLRPTFSAARLAAVLAGLAAGVWLTLKLVERRGYAPALPAPLLLSAAVYVAYNALVGG